MSAVAVRRHLPDRLATVFSITHGETNVFAVGRPCRRMEGCFDVENLAKLRSITMDGIQVLSANEDDLRPVGRPRGIVTRSFAHAARRATLHWPEPQRHLIVAARELPDQKLRMVGGNGEQAGGLA